MQSLLVLLFVSVVLTGEIEALAPSSKLHRLLSRGSSISRWLLGPHSGDTESETGSVFGADMHQVLAGMSVKELQGQSGWEKQIANLQLYSFIKLVFHKDRWASGSRHICESVITVVTLENPYKTLSWTNWGSGPRQSQLDIAASLPIEKAHLLLDGSKRRSLHEIMRFVPHLEWDRAKLHYMELSASLDGPKRLCWSFSGQSDRIVNIPAERNTAPILFETQAGSQDHGLRSSSESHGYGNSDTESSAEPRQRRPS